MLGFSLRSAKWTSLSCSGILRPPVDDRVHLPLLDHVTCSRSAVFWSEQLVHIGFACQVGVNMAPIAALVTRLKSQPAEGEGSGQNMISVQKQQIAELVALVRKQC